MYIYRLGKGRNFKKILKDLGVQTGGINIMVQKMETVWIYIKDIKTPAANILKQDALSIGADLAVPSGVITCEKDYVDALLIATPAQLKTLAKKELLQPFGLKYLAKDLENFLKESKREIKIMGVLNANEDSFYEGSRFQGALAVKYIEQMIEDGANIIDIGAVSSRPGAKDVSKSEELKRLEAIFKAIKEARLYEKALFSIDSYTPEVIRYALDSGFKLINDITGARDERIISLARDYGVKLCIMHMQGTPKTMQNNPNYDDVMIEIDNFFHKQIKRCEELGLKRDSLILDVGIGFGKSLEHNLTLLKDHSNFLRYGCELLIGASRKSMIDKIIPTPVQDRLAGTLAIHLKAIENGATIVRCHDVAEHKQAISVWEAMN